MSFDIALNGILANMKNLQQVSTALVSAKQFSLDETTQQTTPDESINSVTAKEKQPKLDLTEAMVDTILLQKTIAANVFTIKIEKSMEETLFVRNPYKDIK
jgi:flagellar basal body rod protein FlgC